MKKFLSLAFALALCFSLTVPAFAANKAGDTTVTDKSGNIYTLSKPILYTIPVSDLEAIQGSSYILNRIKEETSGVYAVSTGTVITAPNGGWIDSMLGVWLTQEGDACKVDEDDGGGYPWKSFEYEDGSQGLLAAHFCKSGGAIDESTGYLTSDAVNNGMIAFFVPWDETAGSPFTSKSTPSTPSKPSTPTGQTFTDVAANAYYANSVAWAVDKGITAGTSKTTFSPNSTCTTAQILTFLWRSQGSPEPTSKTNTFTDIKESDYFYKAALWAKENNIVSRDSTVFNGNTPCTRSSAVLYIWRAAGFPAATKASSFTDVAATTIYAPAVDWAVEQGVTSGTSKTTFSPDTTCTRAQIVTFLYRAFAK